jgi:hypothetical protein
MLLNYYDMSQTDQFEATFGQLYIGKHPTKDRNSLMCLHFDFSSIPISDSIATTRDELDECIKTSLRAFLSRYSEHFDECKTNGVLLDNGTSALQRLLVSSYQLPDCVRLYGQQQLVEESGHKLFVAVDEYDAPANTCLFSDDPDHRQQFSKISELFKCRFFAVMKKACSSVVKKYWITGVLPAFRDGISPLCATDDISSLPQYNSLCGLTQEEVSLITRAYLRDLQPQRLDLIQEELKRWYGGYKFCAHSSSTAPPPSLYNPQEVFNYLRKIGVSGDLIGSHDDGSVLHSENVFKAIPNCGPLSFDEFFLDALSDKLHTQILTTIEADQVKQIGREAKITWTLLYYLGVLTRGNEPSHIRFPNKSVVLLVSGFGRS